MSERKRNKLRFGKKIASIFKNVPLRHKDGIVQPNDTPGQHRSDYKDLTSPAKEHQELQATKTRAPKTSKPQMKRAYHKHSSTGWFARRKHKAIAEMEEKLKAESQARVKAEKMLRAAIASRAASEKNLKAEAEKMLATQYRRHTVLAERIEANARKEIAQARKKTEAKLRAYEIALAQAEEKLAEAEEKARTQTRRRTRDKESLSEQNEERQRLDVQVAKQIETAREQAEKAQEKHRSYETALAQAGAKLAKAEERAKAEARQRAEVEKRLLVSAKAEAAAGNEQTQEQQNIKPQTEETTKISKRIHWHTFHPKKIMRVFAIISALIILSAIAFAVSIINHPAEAEPGSATTQEETPVSITLTASDPDGEQLTYNIVKGPSHGSLTGTAPKLTYTPALNYNGQDSFTFSANDGKADSKKVVTTITVLAVNDAPTANPQSETIKVGKSISTTLTGSDVDGDSLTFTICTQPEQGSLTLDSNFDTNGSFTYTPNPRFTGTDIFTFKANDGKIDSATAIVSINVTSNNIPAAESYAVSTAEDTPVAISLTGSDIDKDPLAYSTVTGPAHGSLDGTAPNLIYTPETNFNGSDSFTFKVNDGIEDSVPATISITVSSVNDPPIANGDAITTQEDTPAAAIDVQANDTDIDNNTLTVIAVSQGTNGTVMINPDGTLTYSPNADFSGTDTFTYTISDDKGQTDTAQVKVTINMLNDAPVFASIPVTTAKAGVLYKYDVNATDPDAEDTLTYSLTTKPADMTINSATGLIQWKPTEAQVGINEVVVEVADSNDIPAIATQTFTIKVNPPPPRIAKLTVMDGYNQRSRKTLSADSETNIVQSSDNNRCQINRGLYMSYDFPDLSIPADAKITSVVARIEHFEEERFARGKLEWAIGTGWPTKPTVWDSIKAPVHEGDLSEATDSWDITNIVDTREKINALQLQVKNNNNITNKKTMIDYIYVIVQWD